MDIHDKTKEQLISELQVLLQENNSLKALKEKEEVEFIIANKELAFQNEEKEKRAEELIIADKELDFQYEEKEKRAAELIVADKELGFQQKEKGKRAAELVIANKELLFQNEEKEKRANELIIANKELLFQLEEKEKSAGDLVVANKELAFQNEEKEKRANELIIANKELLFQNEEKEKRAAELIIANKELAFQNEEKEKRANELIIANKELIFQNKEKEKRAEELIIADKELDFQNIEKEKRADELAIANKELIFQNEEIDKNIIIIKQADVELKESKEQLSNFASNLQLVLEEERLNLAREIHDSLAQLLVALKMEMGMYKKKISKTSEAINPEEVIAEMEQLMIQVDNANKSARSIMNGLRPEQLEVLGFVEAAEVHLRTFEQTHHIKCRFKNTVLDPNIHPDPALALFRILQESLNNILKHARATMVMVQLTNVAGKLVMEISDNGIGFDVNRKSRPDSYGLIGMKERVKLLGGNLDITSKVGEGTMVKAEIHCRA
jgi:signal transduction histidine kinase